MNSLQKRWTDDFVRHHGRKPKILHIGNIANNAYLNAKLQYSLGMEADVLCYDYYHVMGCPEWAEADMKSMPKDQYFPDWSTINLRGYKRPRWFVQGPLKTCLRYLLAKNQGKISQAGFWWRVLAYQRTAIAKGWPFSIIRIRQRHRSFRLWTESTKWSHPGHAAHNVLRRGIVLWLSLVRFLIGVIRLTRSVLLFPFLYLVRMLRRFFKSQADPGYIDRSHVLVDLFKDEFPTRKDQLKASDLEHFSGMVADVAMVLKDYDIVQAYATDPIWPLLCGIRPYVAFEHGTLRTFTLEDHPVHRCTALAYNQADHVFITNGDCLDYAKKIGVTRFSPMLHPVDEKFIREIKGERECVQKRFGVRHLFLCPLRHDWEVKGTDRYIRALPSLRRELKHPFRVFFTRWGLQVGESQELARSLGVEDLIEWIEPMNRRRLISFLKSMDAVWDQLVLPHFGSTAPEAIAAQIPVIMSYNPSSTRWIISEPAPILSAMNEEDIVAAVELCVDQEWLEDYKGRAREWFDRYHSTAVLGEKYLNVYQSLIEKPKWEEKKAIV